MNGAEPCGQGSLVQEASASLAYWLAGKSSEAGKMHFRRSADFSGLGLPLLRSAAPTVMVASTGLISTSQSHVLRVFRLLAILVMGTIACGVRVWRPGGNEMDWTARFLEVHVVVWVSVATCLSELNRANWWIQFYRHERANITQRRRCYFIVASMALSCRL